MKRIAVALVVLIFAVAAQSQAPKPAPELKVLDLWTGDWTVEGQAKDSPSGPEYKWTWATQGRSVLGGFFMEGRLTDKSPRGETTSLLILGYDPIKKHYVGWGFMDSGGTWAGTATFKDGIWVLSATNVSADGKPIMKWRNTATLSPDRMSFSLKGEQEKDGTWWTSMTGKGVKTKAAPKGQ